MIALGDKLDVLLWERLGHIFYTDKKFTNAGVLVHIADSLAELNVILR